VSEVIKKGKISNAAKGKKYCFATHAVISQVWIYCDKRKSGTLTFTIDPDAVPTTTQCAWGT